MGYGVGERSRFGLGDAYVTVTVMVKVRVKIENWEDREVSDIGLLLASEDEGEGWRVLTCVRMVGDR